MGYCGSGSNDERANGSLRLTRGLGRSKNKKKKEKTHRKQIKMDQKEYPTRPKWNQKGSKRVPNDANIAPKSSYYSLQATC